MRKRPMPDELDEMVRADELLVDSPSAENTEMPADTEPVRPLREKPNRLTIVGMGGSAGSIPAMESFFQNTPTDVTSAYVVVLHLSPMHESHLASIFSRATDMPVQQV